MSDVIKRVILPDGQVFQLSAWGDYPKWSRLLEPWESRTKIWHAYMSKKAKSAPKLRDFEHSPYVKYNTISNRCPWYLKQMRKGNDW